MEFERGLLEIARVSLENASLTEALERVERITAHTLEVTRVSVWQLDGDGAAWRCLSALDARTGDRGAGWTLDTNKYPSYQRAIANQRTLAVSNTREDPASREMLADYFDPLNIGATLDVPIYRGGKIFGLLCCEMVDDVREWSDRERAFATAVAELVASIFEQSARRDVESRLAQSEQRRRDAEKMEALGRMAAAVAHDFNNVLGVVQLLTDTLARSHADPRARERTIELLRESTETGRRLTRRLVSCARAEDVLRTPVRLSAIVEGLRGTLEGLVSPSTLSIEAQHEEDSVLADRVGIEQILLNLAANARDAIAHDRGAVTVRVWREDNEVHLSLADNGEGMDAATRSRIFEPFFSTRANKNNAGLGMATVFRIVEAHQGSILVRTAPREGTTIEIILPALDSSR